ncbi:hypothetical protein RYX36_030696 [Vicia faba]
MGLSKDSCCVFMLQLFILVCLLVQCFDVKVHADLNATLVVDASQASARPIPDTLFGLFFEIYTGADDMFSRSTTFNRVTRSGPKVVPIQSLLQNVGKDMNVIVPPHSFTLLDLLKETNKLMMPESDSSTRSSI